MGMYFYAAKRAMRELEQGWSLRRIVFVEIAVAATVLVIGCGIVVAVLYRADFLPL
jgi:hypothetical protein